MTHTVLIANRGEIACRIVRACRALGLRAVAIYSEADRDALHCKLADAAICVGPAAAHSSYLNIDSILAAAALCAAGAIHPGYGFLAENAEFARRVQAAGLSWIGPRPEIIEAMGNKERARAIASRCGLPILPGSEALQPGAFEQWAKIAREEVGYPLLVKAAGGGGGIGMKKVDAPQQLQATVESAQQMASKSFGDASVYLERYVPRARHVEIQIFGYGDGDAVHVFERDCSAQRRFQKIFEESPAPDLPEHVVDAMAGAAVALAKAQRYAGAGTVEFIVDAATHAFYFLEMNTRIQVEHPVTEMVSGLDLVQMQIQLVLDPQKRLVQSAIARHGVALECRIYAENPHKRFLPSPGRITRLHAPAEGAQLRFDCGVREGDAVTPFYDPMLAKLIVHASTRGEALARLRSALQELEIDGVHTNIAFLRHLFEHADVVRGSVDTGFVERELQTLLAMNPSEAIA